ncbi:acetyltransferase (GNAT) family protein [Neolewinella xylanilytica]|uniref:Acetyltransferase (GNAT) family protein n=1 Tax=Neolewinella xylanilytica TaxID=1514080 RepID=A0A2S6I0E3_9BACT|nr:GNAT family N-acetyltransferase [Neolewinella xylanilytica]PPK84319.1 acetyltransferase (GNAT) family protein [Neolewinella xylanilytica]
MQYRPGRESDFGHLETFVWQAIFPTFDVPGLTDSQRSENDRLVEEAKGTVEAALRSKRHTVWVAWDEKKRSLAGYLVLHHRSGALAVVDQLIVRKGDRGTGVAKTLWEHAVETDAPGKELLAAVRYYNERALAFFGGRGLENTGESAGDFDIPRILLRKEGTVSSEEEDPGYDDFPTEADEVHLAPVYAELPDYQLATEEAFGEAGFDPETTSLDRGQIEEVEDFIAKARRLKAEQERRQHATSGSGRHPEVAFEIDYGNREEPAETVEGKKTEREKGPSLGFEFAFDGESEEPARGAQNDAEKTEEETVDHLDLEDLPEPEEEMTPAELRETFEDRLGERLTAYFGPDELPRYLTVYRNAENFHRIRDAQLASLSQWINGRPPGGKVGQRKDRVMGELIEYFVVEPAAGLHDGLFPQKVLRYQGTDWERVDLFRMVMDYLDFQAVSEQVYTDFVIIPPKVLKRATTTYLQTSRDERLFFICDQSIFGAGKQGFAMTDAGIYWKNVLQPPGAATYTTLRQVMVRDDHLLIDGQYFDAGKRLNAQVALLLDKLHRLDPPK